MNERYNQDTTLGNQNNEQKGYSVCCKGELLFSVTLYGEWEYQLSYDVLCECVNLLLHVP